MADIISCPSCQRRLHLPDEFVGQEVECPSCQTRFIAGAPPAVRAESESDPGIESSEQARRRLRHTRSGPLYLTDRTDASLPSRSGHRLAWLLGGLVTVVVLAAGIVFSLTREPEPLRMRVEDDPRKQAEDEERRRDVAEAFAQQKPLEPAEIAEEIKPLLVELGRSFRARNGAAIAACFDPERLFDELVKHNVLGRELLRGRREFLKGMEMGLAPSLQQQAPLMEWHDFEIRHVKKLEGNEAAVIVRHRTVAGFSLKMRWWVTKRPGTWKVFDMEDLDSGMSIVTTAASLGPRDLGNARDLPRATPHLREAAMALALRQDADAAERSLQNLAGLALPQRIDALRHMLLGSVKLQRQQFQEALALFDQAHELHRDMPCLDLVKAVAHNSLGAWQKGLKHIQAYQALLGDDAQVCDTLGEALRGVGRFEEAQAAYRKALDYDPGHADAFLGLLRSLAPADKRDDLAARFAKLEVPHENFHTCAEDCRNARDGESLEQLVIAMRKIDAKHPPLDFYLALAKVWMGQEPEGLSRFKDYLTRNLEPAQRQDRLISFLQAISQAGKACEAYAALPDPRETFRILAGETMKAHNLPALHDLVEAHRTKHVDDPLLPFYQGEIHAREGRYALAQKAFAAGMAKPPDRGTLDLFRFSRVSAAYYAGQALQAYADIGPKEQTFQDLARMCFEDDKLDLLESLLERHAKESPGNVDVLLHGVRLKIKRKEVANAVVLLKSALAKETQEDARGRLLSQFLRDMVDADRALEGYEAAPDADKAFQEVAYDLMDAGAWDELCRLVEVHRRRQPNDPLLDYFTAQLHVESGAWDQAVQVAREGLKRAPEHLRVSLRSTCVFAMYKAGRGLDAYRESDDKKREFSHLADMMVNDRKGAELLALAEAHRREAAGDADVLYFEARARALLKQPDDALRLFRDACQKQPNVNLRRTYLSFLLDMLKLGRGVEAYQAATDKLLAFQTLARELVNRKQAKELEALLAEYGKAQDGKAEPTTARPDKSAMAWLECYRGELLLMRGDATGAQKHFGAALAQGARDDKYFFRAGLDRARVAAGQVVAAYEENRPRMHVFEDLAAVCVTEKNARQLEALIDAHRKAALDAPDLPYWEVDARWLNKEYEAAVTLVRRLREKHIEPSHAASARYRWKLDRYLVRCLVKLQRFPEAIAEAQRIAEDKHGDPVLVVLAHAAAGHVKDTIAAAAKLRQRYRIDDCYRDEELGPILRSEPFAEFRKRYPEPAHSLPVAIN